jgi:hypothetical protein
MGGVGVIPGPNAPPGRIDDVAQGALLEYYNRVLRPRSPQVGRPFRRPGRNHLRVVDHKRRTSTGTISLRSDTLSTVKGNS